MAVITSGLSRFDHRQRQTNFSCSLCVQTDSGAHPASCTMGTGVLSPGLKGGQGVTLTTRPHLVPRSKMSRNYTPLPQSAFMACSGIYRFSFNGGKYSGLYHYTSYTTHCLTTQPCHKEWPCRMDWRQVGIFTCLNFNQSNNHRENLCIID
jgi:hypothetical protein